MNRPMQLVVSVAPGDSAAPNVVSSDGRSVPMQVPDHMAFIVTDVSIQRLRVQNKPGLFDVQVIQNISNAAVTRWAFIGSASGNIERSFFTGIKIAGPFRIENGTQSADAVVVRLCGYFDWL